MNDAEIRKAYGLVDTIDRLEIHPLNREWWTIRFGVNERELVTYVLKNISAYNEATPENTIYAVNTVIDFLDSASPADRKRWGWTTVTLGREMSRVIYFNVHQPLKYESDLQIVKERISEIARLAKVDELHYHEEQFYDVPGSEGRLPYWMWHTRIRFWWD